MIGIKPVWIVLAGNCIYVLLYLSRYFILSSEPMLNGAGGLSILKPSLPEPFILFGVAYLGAVAWAYLHVRKCAATKGILVVIYFHIFLTISFFVVSLVAWIYIEMYTLGRISDNEGGYNLVYYDSNLFMTPLTYAFLVMQVVMAILFLSRRLFEKL